MHCFSFLCGSLQKVTDTVSLCAIMSQLLTLKMKNALCVQCGAGGLWQKITSITFHCLAVLWLSHGSPNQKAKHTPSGMLQGEFSQKVFEI